VRSREALDMRLGLRPGGPCPSAHMTPGGGTCPRTSLAHDVWRLLPFPLARCARTENCVMTGEWIFFLAFGVSWGALVIGSVSECKGKRTND
jgi:hypothetical protein